MSSETEIQFHIRASPKAQPRHLHFPFPLPGKRLRARLHTPRNRRPRTLCARCPGARESVRLRCALAAERRGRRTAVWNYQTTRGRARRAAGRWPRAATRSPRRRAARRCCWSRIRTVPCTQASVGELARLMARLRRRVSAHVLVYRPSEFPAGWERTESGRPPNASRASTVHVDVDGAEARPLRRRDFRTGPALRRAGRLRFSGGITNARGHVGESPGQQQIAARRRRPGRRRHGDAVAYLAAPWPARASGLGGRGGGRWRWRCAGPVAGEFPAAAESGEGGGRAPASAGSRSARRPSSASGASTACDGWTAAFVGPDGGQWVFAIVLAVLFSPYGWDGR